MLFRSANRYTAYTIQKKKIRFEKEFSKIEFFPTDIRINKTDESREFSEPVANVIIKAVPVVMKWVGGLLKKRIKKFVYQYSRKGVNREAGSFIIPEIDFTNFIYLNGDFRKALHLKMVPHQLKGTKTFTYSVQDISLHYSKAKTSDLSNVFDYNIDCTLYFLSGIKVEPYKLSPFTVQSVSFGDNHLAEQEVYSDVIPMRKDYCLAAVKLNIVETNPAKVNSEQILNLLVSNENHIKEKVKELVNKLLQ